MWEWLLHPGPSLTVKSEPLDPTGQVLPHELAGQGTGTGTVGGQAGQDPYHSLASAVGMLEMSAPCLGLLLGIKAWP